ncbi:hypothetical protein [Pedobacter sp. Leaf194]|uniref:hypothetical protein n=1 Tax=Pedobacter sp. Leaf194 TaxID=1736297 RepID=UPI00070258FF|nr:hypothetical protein [Pedobacter sp. Leaf194]KQS35745.1 hypothetical protein ASG14_09765 [Pedobacter sp. Leaf194]
MRNCIAIITLFLCITSCKKEIPEPDVVKMDVYSTKIKHTNYNEPDMLNWYIKAATKGGYFYMSTTKDVTNFRDYDFSYSTQLPKELTGKTPYKGVVVWINQLNGDLLFDITGKTVAPAGMD